MSMNDPISDMLTRIRNAQLSKKKKVLVYFSNFKWNILKILLYEGYINNFYLSGDNINYINIELKYFINAPVINSIKRISKPGLRIYKSCKEIPLEISGLGIYILSTSLGVLSDRQARRFKVGGEVICSVN